MKKLLLSFVAMLFAVFANAGDVLYKTLTFPEGNSEAIGSYTTTWTATCEDLTWTIENFNNNNNAWSYIKCGRKNNESTGYITTQMISEKITKVVVSVDACTASKVKASYLEVASDVAFTADVQKVEATIATGDVIYKVPTAKENQYYRLTFDCDAGSSNGLITISKIELYKYDASTVSAPTIMPKGGSIYEDTEITITADPGAEIYYIIDEGLPHQYVEPITISKSCTLSAYAVVGETESETVSEKYVMAESYSSLQELFDNPRAPNLDGVPVIVQIKDEPIKKIVTTNTGFRNGVLLDYYPWESQDMFELYCGNVPAEWKEGDLLSGVAIGEYKVWGNGIEIALLSWDGFTVTSVKPAGPTITPATGTYDADQTVTIVDPTDNNYTIYYTLDGSEPTESSAIYEAPFTVTETTTVKAVYVDDDDNMSAVSTAVITINKQTVYTTIAELVENCTATSSGDAPTIEFAPDNLVVTGVNASNVFVADNTGAFLLYGSNSNLKKGDVISGNIRGKLYKYNGLPELSVSDKWANITKKEETVAVTPQTMKAADVSAADASKYVRFEGLQFVSSAEVSGKTNYTMTDGTTEVVIRDQFNCLAEVFAEGQTYNVNVYVIPFRDAIQYYAVSAEDISTGVASDVNSDGIVDTQDVLAVYEKMQIGIYDSSADVNGDGVIDTQDVLAIYETISNQ